MYPTHRKDPDILASHRLMSDFRNYLVSVARYDETKRLQEAIAKVQKAINAGQSEPPVPVRDPFIYVADERVKAVLGGKQPEPVNVDINELQSVHHAAPGPGPKQEPIIKGGKGEGRKGEKGGKGDSPAGPQTRSDEASGKGSGKGDSPAVPKAKVKADAGPTPMDVDPPEAQPKKSWVAIAVEGSRPRRRSRRGRGLQLRRRRALRLRRLSLRRRSRLTRRLRSRRRRRVETMLLAIAGARLISKGEKGNRWDPEAPSKESSKREASKRPDDVDSRPGAAAREASGDDLHSALGRSSAKDAAAPLTASKAMAKKPEGSEIRLRSAGRVGASPVEGHFATLPDATMVEAQRWKSSIKSWQTPVQDGNVGERMFPERLPGGPLGLWAAGTPETQEGAGIGHEGTKIEIGGETIVGIVVMMNRMIEVGIGGETIAGDARGIETGTVRGADVTGGGVTIADRLRHEGCGR